MPKSRQLLPPELPEPDPLTEPLPLDEPLSLDEPDMLALDSLLEPELSLGGVPPGPVPPGPVPPGPVPPGPVPPPPDDEPPPPEVPPPEDDSLLASDDWLEPSVLIGLDPPPLLDCVLPSVLIDDEPSVSVSLDEIGVSLPSELWLEIPLPGGCWVVAHTGI